MQVLCGRVRRDLKNKRKRQNMSEECELLEQCSLLSGGVIRMDATMR